MRKPKATANFSTTLSKEAKEALLLFCMRRGLKINHFLEEIIWDRLEDEMDAEVADSVDYRSLIPMKDVIRKRA